jgi:hypothetical protein
MPVLLGRYRVTTKLNLRLGGDNHHQVVIDIIAVDWNHYLVFTPLNTCLGIASVRISIILRVLNITLGDFVTPPHPRHLRAL